MKHEDKINFMHDFCKRNNCELTLESYCGFNRPCVGVMVVGKFPDYEWGKDEDFDFDGFIPPNAYHKHPCVAVLGWGESSECELYDWLKWFDDNGYKLVVGNIPKDELEGYEYKLFGKSGLKYARMVKE